MKKLAFISTFLFSTSIFAQQYKTGQGFQYKNDAKEKKEEAEKNPQVRVLRFYNQNSKVSDPLSERQGEKSDTDEGSGVQFFKVTDATLTNPNRDIAAIKNLDITDYAVLEDVIRDLEKQMGVKSMPVVKFSKQDEVNLDNFVHRIQYLEFRLGILKESQEQNLVLGDRIQNIKDKMQNR